MPTDPHAIQRLAVELSRRSQPAELWAAVGRCYYAAFNVAAEMLRGWGITITRNASGHGEVLRYLGNSNDAELVAAAYDLGILRGRRNSADYDLAAADVENSKTVQLSVDTAGRLIAAMDACLVPPRSEAIVAAIEDYRRKIAPQSPPAS